MGDSFRIDEIEALLKALDAHDVTEFRITRGEDRLWLRRGGEPRRWEAPRAPEHVSQTAPSSLPEQSGSAPRGDAEAFSQSRQLSLPSAAPAAGSAPGEAAQAASRKKPLVDIASPMVGTFYRRPAVDAKPYVEVGDLVKKGDILCIVEAMKLMNEIESTVSGRVAEICLDDAQMVEYGEVLFRMEPTG